MIPYRPCILAALLLSVFAPPVAAQQGSVARPAPTGEPRPAPDPTLELTAVYFVETWDFNGRAREALAGGTAAVSVPIGRSRWSVLIELAGLRAAAPRSPDALVAGPSVFARRRLGSYRATIFFAEIGAGPSYATRAVPDGGTRFNYMLQAGAGAMGPIGGRAGAIISLRHFHLSNNSLNGPSHNPDIQALGGHIGVWIRF